MREAVDIERTYQQQTAPAGSLFETFAEQVLRRTEDVIAGRDCLIPPTAVQMLFVKLLQRHQGEGRACSRLIWAEYLQVNDRTLRELVQSLRQDFGVAIGTATNGGYFLIATREEFDEAIRQLTLHAVTVLRVAKGMSGGRYEDLLHQLRLQLNTEDAR